MARTVHEVSELCGVSVRTLHYYDEIGLLKPSQLNGAGYRMYDDAAIAKLQQIMMLRELDFSLKQIASIMARPDFDPTDALNQQRHLLALKRDRLNRLIALVDEIVKGESFMDFEAFDTTQIEAAKKEYGAEARERWGDTDAYRQSAERTARYTKADWAAIQKEVDAIYRGFVAAMPKGADSPEARKLAAEWQAHISRFYYDCGDDILKGLAEMWVADERFTRNIDKHAAGLAQFMHDAVNAYLSADREAR